MVTGQFFPRRFSGGDLFKYVLIVKRNGSRCTSQPSPVRDPREISNLR